MKKKLFALICTICAFICAFSLAACSGGNNESWTTTGTLTKDDDGNVVFNNVQIKLSTIVSGADVAPFNQVIQQFNRQYKGKISVDVTNVDQDLFDTTVQRQIANNNNAPDLLMSHQKGHMAFAQNKLIQPFNEVMEASGITFDMNDYADGLAKYTSLGYEGKLYSIPCDAQSSVVLYNKKMLEKYELEVPTNHSELVSVCTAVANGEKITPIVWSTAHDAFPNYIFTTAVMQNGGKLYKDDYYADWYGDSTNQTAIKNAIASIRGLINNRPALATKNQSLSDALQKFLNDEALFYFVTPWEVSNVLDAYVKSHSGITLANVKADYVGGASMANWFAMQDNTENGNKIYGDSHFFAMSATVSDINVKAAICEFVKWITNNASIGAEWAEAGHISMSKKIDGNQEYYENSFVKNYIKKFYPDINDFVCMGNTPYAMQLQTHFGKIIIDAIEQSSDSSDASIIKSNQDKFNEAIDFIKM